MSHTTVFDMSHTIVCDIQSVNVTQLGSYYTVICSSIFSIHLFKSRRNMTECTAGSQDQKLLTSNCDGGNIDVTTNGNEH